jgi:hypothetical protein
MIRKMIFPVLCSALLLPAVNLAAETLSERFERQPPGDKFPSSETTLDVFGSWRVATDKDLSGGHLGVGAGINHFFSSYFGAGAELGAEGIDWPNHVNASFIVRYPLEKWSLAPYGFVGFGREFHDTPQWMFHLGGGVDYRLNAKAGMFADVRLTAADVSADSVLWRFGVRFGF